LRWTFYVFVFSLPFETVTELIREQLGFSLSKVTGYLFFCCAMIQPTACFGLIPRASWFFAAYLACFAILGFSQDAQHWDLVGVRLFQQVQMLVLLLVSYNLMRGDRTRAGALWAVAFSVVTLAVLQLLGVTAVEFESAGGQRISALTENVNTVGANLALGFVVVLGLGFARDKKVPLARLIGLGLIPLISLALVNTGSRGAILALGIGLICFALKSGTTRRKILLTLVVVAAAGVCVWIIERTEMALTRFEMTIFQRSLASRERILPAAWEMFSEKPLVGWGPEHHYFELGVRTGREVRDPHNLLLWVLNEVGLIGGVPFVMGLAFCLYGAWRARGGTEGVLPLALFLTLLAINMSGTFHNRKVHWLVLAYALASAPKLVRQKLVPARRAELADRSLMALQANPSN
jgi:O-antigen ligase